MSPSSETTFKQEKGFSRTSHVKMYKEVLPVPNQDFSLPVLIFLHKGKVQSCSPVLFLVNGFCADYKTFTFRPLREKGAFAPSFAEFMAEQGFIVIVKALKSERAYHERSFMDYVRLVPDYIKAVVEHGLPLIRNITGIKPQARGLHWIGHSLGGMVAAASPIKDGMLSLTTISSPTYMYLEEPRLLALCRLLRPLFPFRWLNKRIPIPVTWTENFLDYMFARYGIESHKKLSHDQHLLIGLLLHLPFVRILSHLALNLDHIDFETAAAFMRSATANESFQFLLDFVDGLLVDGRDKTAILKQPLVPFSVPTLVIGGEADRIAPVHSAVHLLNFVKGAKKEKVVFNHYDHLGLLLKYGARFDVWPVIVAFVYEQACKAAKNPDLSRQAREVLSALSQDSQLGNKASAFARRTLLSLGGKPSPHHIISFSK